MQEVLYWSISAEISREDMNTGPSLHGGDGPTNGIIMPKTVTRNRARQRRHGGSDATIRAVSIAICAFCAIYAVWRAVSGSRELPRNAGDGGGEHLDAAHDATPPPSMRISEEQRQVPDGGTAKGALARVTTRVDAAPAATKVHADNEAAGSTGGVAISANSGGMGAEVAGRDAVYGAPQEKEYFDNEVENMVASVSEPGAEFFGFPPSVDLPEEEILAILKRPVEIFEDDGQDAIAAKERTAEFKALALEAIEKDGLTFNQFIRDLSHLRNEQAAMREDARSEMIKILKTRGEAEARKYLDGVNAELKAQGIRELELSDRLVKMLLSEKD